MGRHYDCVLVVLNTCTKKMVETSFFLDNSTRLDLSEYRVLKRKVLLFPVWPLANTIQLSILQPYCRKIIIRALYKCISPRLLRELTQDDWKTLHTSLFELFLANSTVMPCPAVLCIKGVASTNSTVRKRGMIDYHA